MKLLKKINNNFALAIDGNGEKVIVEGRGIGFNRMPCIIDDLSKIDRTYYVCDEHDIHLINTLPQEIIDVANIIYKKILDDLSCQLNDNLPFVLADHLNFAIERYSKGIHIKMPLDQDLKQIYPLEYKIAKYALIVVEKKLNIKLPSEEIAGIMLNIINAEVNKDKIQIAKEYEKRNKKIIEIIETMMNIHLLPDSFSYSRFLTHMNYLYDRGINNKLLNSDNKQMYEDMVLKYPKINDTVETINNYLNSNCDLSLNNEEKLYLILHINRLCERESNCNF